MDEKKVEGTEEMTNEELNGTEANTAEQAPENEYKAKCEEYLQLLQRNQADFDNYRRRVNQEREEWVKYASAKLAANLLPVLDNFERALGSAGDDLTKFKEGIDMIYRQMVDTLSKEGVKPLETVGKEFDPTYHQAVMQGPSDEYPENTVIEELQKGYTMAERVLRPAMVKVSSK